MLEATSAWLAALPSLLVQSLVRVLLYPINSGERLYWLYLLSSLCFAGAAYAASRRPALRPLGLSDFTRFCFPREIWSQAGAWLDVRYFFLHQLVRVWIYGGLSAAIALASAHAVSAWLRAALGAPPSPPHEISGSDRVLIALLAVALGDFVGFAAHALQHRIPLLWEFHRVHHSLTVMHPLSNYREHWVDNLLYALVHSATAGAVTSSVAQLYGRPVAPLEVLGVNCFVFLFNVAGYNLRHSHVWVAWPGWLGWLLGSPAYHQIHHSVDPRHVDKNFAFLFPVWDWLFGCAVLPRARERLRFGLGDGTEGEYRSVARLYFLPFVRLWRGAGRRALRTSSAASDSMRVPAKKSGFTRV